MMKINRRDFLKAGIGSAALISVPGSAGLFPLRDLGKLVMGTAPPLLGLTRLPDICQTDFRQSVVGAPVQTFQGGTPQQYSSDDYIRWHVLNTESPARGTIWLDPTAGSWDGGNVYWTQITYDPLHPENTLFGGGAPLVNITTSDYPSTDVHPMDNPTYSDGVGNDNWARGFYHIPAVCIDQPGYFQRGSPGIARVRNPYVYDHHFGAYNSENNTLDEFYQLEWNGDRRSVPAGNLSRGANGVVTVTLQGGQTQPFAVGDTVSLYVYPPDPNFPPGNKIIASVTNTQFTYNEPGPSNVSSAAGATLTKINGANWECYIACRFNCNSIAASRRPYRPDGTGTPPPGTLYYGPIASGLSMLAGSVTYDELFNTDGKGEITHAINCCLAALGASGTDQAGGCPYFCYPASAAQTLLRHRGAIPMGSRIRLKSAYDETQAFGPASGLPPASKDALQRYLRCLKTYGFIVSDGNQTNFELTPFVTPDARFNAVGQIWADAMRSGVGVANWRSGSWSLTGRAMTQQPQFEDFDVVQHGWPVDPGHLYQIGTCQ